MDVLPKLAGLLLAPPGVIILLGLFSFFIYLKKPWIGAFFFSLTTAALIVVSLPMTGHHMLTALSSYAPPLEWITEKDPKTLPKAIVVLGGGRYASAPEYGADTVGGRTLERLRYAAWLQRKTGLPILVSGGSPNGEELSEGQLMRQVLSEDFRANVKWLEGKSHNTKENALYSSEMLSNAGIKHVYLVTHAWHMRRAAWAFERYGIQVTPAPTGFSSLGRADRGFIGYLPSARGMQMTSYGVHEHLGYLWYTYRPEKDSMDTKK